MKSICLLTGFVFFLQNQMLEKPNAILKINLRGCFQEGRKRWWEWRGERSRLREKVSPAGPAGSTSALALGFGLLARESERGRQHVTGRLIRTSSPYSPTSGTTLPRHEGPGHRAACMCNTLSPAKQSSGACVCVCVLTT